jgi:hypothetical protein
MAKRYQDRQMASSERPEREFFFPKSSPPVTIRATSREEAEKKLAALNTKEA